MSNDVVKIDLVFSCESADMLKKAMEILACIHAEHPNDERFNEIAGLVNDAISATDIAES